MVEFSFQGKHIDQILNNHEYEEIMAKHIMQSSVWKKHEKSKGNHQLLIQDEENSEESQNTRQTARVKNEDHTEGFNYDKKNDNVFVGCSCGARFAINTKDDSVYLKDANMSVKEKGYNQTSQTTTGYTRPSTPSANITTYRSDSKPANYGVNRGYR